MLKGYMVKERLGTPDLEHRFLTFFYLSTPFGHAYAVHHPLPLAETWLL